MQKNKKETSTIREKINVIRISVFDVEVFSNSPRTVPMPPSIEHKYLRYAKFFVYSSDAKDVRNKSILPEHAMLISSARDHLKPFSLICTFFTM